MVHLQPAPMRVGLFGKSGRESSYVQMGVWKATSLFRREPQAQSKPARVLKTRPSTEPGCKTAEA